MTRIHTLSSCLSMAALVLVAGLFGCSSPSDGPIASGGSAGAATAGSNAGTSAGGTSSGGGLDGSGGGPKPIPNRECKPASESPSFSIVGTSCGKAVKYDAPVGVRVLVSHSSLAEQDTVNVFTIADTQDFTYSQSHDFLLTHDLMFNIGVNGNVGFAEGSGTLFTLGAGVISACGLGTIGFKPGTSVQVALDKIASAGRFGTIRITISDIQVQGSSDVLGATAITLCDGVLTATFEGEYERVR